MEYWDLYTKDRKPTGETHLRGEPLPEDRYHLVVHVWIKNAEGQYLISQRAADRPTFPLKWECVGGAVTQGENSLEGALREAWEEVGIALEPSRGKLLFSKLRGEFDGRRFNDFMDVWEFETDDNPDPERWATQDGAVPGDCRQACLTTAAPFRNPGCVIKKEVAQSRWMTREEVEALYREGELVETLDYFFSAVDVPVPDYSGVIGKIVSGKIDRPMGSVHPRKPKLFYPINYGYVPEVIGGDGSAQDVYLLGVDHPVEDFTGRVIAVFHRFNDVENKWVVAPEGMDFTDDEILGAISFTEQFFYGRICR